jgi:hypothetical protein
MTLWGLLDDIDCAKDIAFAVTDEPSCEELQDYFRIVQERCDLRSKVLFSESESDLNPRYPVQLEFDFNQCS